MSAYWAVLCSVSKSAFLCNAELSEDIGIWSKYWQHSSQKYDTDLVFTPVNEPDQVNVKLVFIKLCQSTALHACRETMHLCGMVAYIYLWCSFIPIRYICVWRSPGKCTVLYPNVPWMMKSFGFLFACHSFQNLCKAAEGLMISYNLCY